MASLGDDTGEPDLDIEEGPEVMFTLGVTDDEPATATAPAPAAGTPVGSAATSGRAGEGGASPIRPRGVRCATPGRGVRAGRRRRRRPPRWPRNGELYGATGRSWARRRRRTTARRRHLSKPRESREVRSGGMGGRVGVGHGTTDARSRWTRTTPAMMTSRATRTTPAMMTSRTSRLNSPWTLTMTGRIFFELSSVR